MDHKGIKKAEDILNSMKRIEDVKSQVNHIKTTPILLIPREVIQLVPNFKRVLEKEMKRLRKELWRLHETKEI